MLVLGRRPGDSIVIDGGIRVVVLACDRGGVRLGIEAPPDVTILRGEIVRAVEEENRRATAPAGAKAWIAALAPKDGARDGARNAAKDAAKDAPKDAPKAR